MRFACALVALMSLLLPSCGSISDEPVIGPATDPPFLPAGEADIVGTVARVMPESDGRPLRILVEAGDQKDVVSVLDSTRVYREEGTKLRDASPSDLREGLRVKAWYDGAVKESLPRQANAEAVVIAAR
jgi:hypothetical protein